MSRDFLIMYRYSNLTGEQYYERAFITCEVRNGLVTRSMIESLEKQIQEEKQMFRYPIRIMSMTEIIDDMKEEK
jgi:hypothetical protein